jgi:DNA-binding response OmpR family regulator
MGDPSNHGMTVLVADDEPNLRALVVECVRGLGCKVIEARDGFDAWQLAQRQRPDVVVLDVMMPGMSGWEVCKLVKTEGKTSRGSAPKVLMLTGIGENLNEMTSPLFSADDWIDKPFALAELADKVGKLCRQASGAPSDTPSGPDLAKAAPRSSAARASKSATPAESATPKKYGRAHERSAAASTVELPTIANAPAAPTAKSQARKRRKQRRRLLKARARVQAVAKSSAKKAPRKKAPAKTGAARKPKKHKPRTKTAARRPPSKKSSNKRAPGATRRSRSKPARSPARGR